MHIPILFDADSRCDGWRQIVEIDGSLIAQGHGSLNAVFQFAHVSRPVVLQQCTSWLRW